jgi:hypothetical protein
MIQNGINVDNASLDGWFSGGGVKVRKIVMKSTQSQDA